MSDPLLSIVIPALNEVEVVAKTLAPLQLERGANVEIIFVDGGSTDDTVQNARSLVDVVEYSSPGRARQMNAGAAIARGKYLAFLHADSQISTVALRELLKICNEESAAWGFFKIRLDNGRLPFRIIETFMNWRSRLSGVATGDQSLFVKLSTFRDIGGYRIMPLMEDIEISKRLRNLARPRIVRVPVITSARRWENNGVMATVLLMWWLRLAYFIGVSPARIHAWYYSSPDERGNKA